MFRVPPFSVCYTVSNIMSAGWGTVKDVHAFVFGLNGQDWEQELDTLAESSLETDFDRILDGIIFEQVKDGTRSQA